MKTQKLTKHLRNLILLFLLGLSQSATAQPQVDITRADVTNALSSIRSQWAVANYDLQGEAQNKAFVALLSQVESVTVSYPNAAEAWIWDGIIKSSYAGVKGGLGALSLIKESRLALEKALSLDAAAMQGSAYTSLGTLYYKVPGWPIAFGDDDKAKQLLKQALKISPDGIDSNYFYADFLQEDEKYAEAKTYLLKARQAAPRPAYPLEDKGRQQAISVLLASIEKELKYEKTPDNEFE